MNEVGGLLKRAVALEQDFSGGRSCFVYYRRWTKPQRGR